jgi:hypothetical protein
MANTKPFERLTGTLAVYIAPAIEGMPVVNATPAGNWVTFGFTDGDQKIKHSGDLTFFRDNEHPGPVKAVRAEEDVTITAKLVSLTLEHYARVLNNVSKVVAGGSPAVKTIPMSKGFVPTEYSILLKGSAASPYGAFPAQYYIPRCVLGGEPEPTFAKDGSPGLEISIRALHDDTQGAGLELGWLQAQTS